MEWNIFGRKDEPYDQEKDDFDTDLHISDGLKWEEEARDTVLRRRFFKIIAANYTHEEIVILKTIAHRKGL